ncbi:purple acid phosphatase 15-like [Papaver somniferum]|uniref:purple acid phosphatase 15-like n=1 Tax=Papaver somniferum TaxID=3469 RepID=UPI000E70596D|nr:purple acid phosphatase 15-like [Papaver somniferum]
MKIIPMMMMINFVLLSFFFGSFFVLVNGDIPTTLDGPFDPVTVPFDDNFRGHAVDLPDTDPRVQRNVKGFEPEQISVSLSAFHDSVWISWITGEYQIGDDVKPLNPKTVGSLVRYGTLRFPLFHEATGHSLVYSQLYPFQGLKNYTSGIIHHVRLTGLNPSTLYYYRCGDPSIPALSPLLSFKTMPISSPRSYPGRIAIVGDLGLTYNTTSTIDHLISNSPDLVVLVGDVTYANLYLTNGTGSDCYSCSFKDTPIHETYQPRWDYWGRYMQPLISKVPIMVVEGNHEIEAQADNKTFAAYSSRFAFPNEESGSSSTFYYSFNAGGIHFIMLGAYIDYNKSGEQYNWLEKDLANVDRSVTPWLVTTWHPPWYNSYKPHYREAECMRVAMEDLLYSYGVDMVFNGHVHAYERSNRVYNYSLDPCGPVYITVGDGGNREKMAVKHADEPGNCPDPSTTPDEYMGGFCAFNFTSGPAAGKFCWDRQPDFSAYRESSFGHGILEVKNDTHALWTWHRNQDLYNSFGDQIYIVRQPDRCPVQPKVIKSRVVHHLLPSR